MIPTIALCAIAAASAFAGTVSAVKYGAYVAQRGTRGSWPHLVVVWLFQSTAVMLIIIAFRLGAA